MVNPTPRDKSHSGRLDLIFFFFMYSLDNCINHARKISQVDSISNCIIIISCGKAKTKHITILTS